MSGEPKDISPGAVLREVVAAIPPELRTHIVIIGSMAAAYWFADKHPTFSVRTKDIGSVLTPRESARATGEAMADELLASGWRPRRAGRFATPGSASTPEEDLPALRLLPPASDEWFLELLTEPEPRSQAPKRWLRFALSNGEHYGLPSFRFTSVAIHSAGQTKFGIRAARPEMMALANLLEHPVIKPDLIDGTSIKRCNKDLGRAIALAWLSDGEFEHWDKPWAAALADRFPATWRDLAAQAGDGLRALVDSPSDLAQAATTCNNGLLASRNVTPDQLKATGQRLLSFSLDDLRRAALL